MLVIEDLHKNDPLSPQFFPSRLDKIVPIENKHSRRIIPAISRIE